MVSQSIGFELRQAAASDAANIAACADAAYRPYVARLGKPPAPMIADYDDVIATAQVWVATRGDVLLGFLVLKASDDAFLLDNIAVDPEYRGLGVGKTLMQWAETEARRQTYSAIHLYTHERMMENQALYARNGYREYDRRTEHGFDRVFMCKRL